MTTRRKFLTKASLGTLGAVAGASFFSCKDAVSKSAKKQMNNEPKVISTWEFGKKANAGAMEILRDGGPPLDAVEQGLRVIEADGSNQSVGYGGLPDREGHVALDASIMAPDGRCGSVCALENILHPITVARWVMEKTPHVILAGEGARQFALANGMKKQNLLTGKARKKWEEWLEKSAYRPVINIENHDTIGMIALDANGDLAGGCTTSGLAFKMRGRVGDSPIIGAGLYVDNDVGGATATGLGEAVLRTVGSFLVVELMRRGHSPARACREAVQRIVEKHKNYKDFQVGFIAMNKAGQTGGFAIHSGFNYALTTPDGGQLIDSPSVL